MTILRGGRAEAPPLWDPLFAMRRLLNGCYGGDYLAMAEDLGHAALPVGIVRLTMDFMDDHKFGDAETALSALSRHAAQKANEPDPYWAVQRKTATAGVEACREAGRATFMTLKWCFDALSNTIGLEALSLACYDQPELVSEAMAWVENRNRLAVEHLVAKVQPDFVFFEGNCAYHVGPMLEPDMLDQFCAEPTRQTLTMLDELGIPAVFHTEGKVDRVAPLVIDWGFAGLHGCDPQANELGELAARFGDAIALAGNMDVALLATATPDEVRRATHQMLRDGMSGGGRFIAGCNTAVQDDVSVDNYVAMCRAVAELQPRTPTSQA